MTIIYILDIGYLDIQERSISDDIRTSETIARISKIIAAQTLPVCLVVTGDGLSTKKTIINHFNVLSIIFL